MLSILAIGLTLIVFCSIIIIAVKKRKRYFVKIVYTQSSIHQMIKNLLPRDLFELPTINSQARKHVEKNTIKVMIVEDKAYWVHDNMFYVAEALNGSVNAETVQPIDTNNMSNRDIDKMLFILDSLKNGNSDDNSSTGNN